jgi:hypothetical protein
MDLPPGCPKIESSKKFLVCLYLRLKIGELLHFERLLMAY